MSSIPKLTRSQEYALEGAVVDAYREGWNGDLRQTNKRPSIWGYRRNVRRNTIHKLIDLGLVTADGYPPRLTKAGVEAGVATFMRDIDSGVHPAEFVAAERRQERDDVRQHDADVARAKRLFRGLKLSSSGWFSRSHAMSRHIEENIGRQHGVIGGSVKLSLEDLLVLGEQIERMR